VGKNAEFLMLKSRWQSCSELVVTVFWSHIMFISV